MISTTSAAGIRCRLPRVRSAEPVPTSGIRLAVAVGLAVTLLAVTQAAAEYAPSTWIERDGRFYVNVNVTLAERGSVVQDEFAASWYRGDLGWNENLDAAWSNLALGRGGAHLPKHPILMPILSTPLFWAFGLHGTLVFNLLMFALGGAGVFAVARRYGSVTAAAAAALGLVLATSLREYAYDYHVDVLILALVSQGVASALGRRGWIAGVLLGGAVMLRPTTLLWLPSIALLLVDRRDWLTLRRALITGAAMMGVIALTNWALFGAPWWSGYNRTLVVVDGVAQLADHSSAFSVPWRDGLRALWSGPYGVSHRLTFAALALPGLLVLGRRRPWVGLAGALAVALSVGVFARYQWYGDRFLWPTLVLLAPAVAATFDLAVRAARRLRGARTPTLAALACVAVVGTQPAIRDAEPSAAWSLLAAAALAWGLTASARRVTRTDLAVLAPLTLLLLPGVRERLLEGGPDLWMAAATCLALGARRWMIALPFAALAGAAVIGSEAGTIAWGAWAPLLAMAGLGAPWLGTRAWLLAPAGLLLIPRVAGLGGEAPPLFALALLTLPLPPLFERAAEWIADGAARLGRRGVVGLAAGALLTLFGIGLAPRLGDAPLELASYEGVRSADVSLGDVPCDFLAWEHLNWECATFDRGVHDEVGLATSQPLHVHGQEARMLLISASGARPREVTWEGVRGSDALRLEVAVPDELGGGGRLDIEVDGERVDSIPLASAPGRQALELPTPDAAGRDVTLTLRLHGPRAAVLVDGGFGAR